ncbi:transposase family protein [Deinococcus sp.]|uniref:transposase family protein n=1 Tax=Deinococcus sp. TaxID=47478 RepID=UPI00391DAACE
MSHDRLERLRKLNRTRFKRHTWISSELFAEMAVAPDQRERCKTKPGRAAALNTAHHLLLTLEFWREYRTFAHLSQAWSIHESTVQRTETALIGSGKFRLPDRKSFKQVETVLHIIAVDAAETPCERPTSQQRQP